MRRVGFLAGILSILLAAISGPAVAAQQQATPQATIPAPAMITLTAPVEYPDLQGVKVRFPEGTALPPQDLLWSQIRQGENERRLIEAGYMERPEDFRLYIHKHLKWYEQYGNAWVSHSNWIKGTEIGNESSGPVAHYFSATGSLSATFSGTASAKSVVSASFNLSSTISLAYQTVLTVQPGKKLTLWVAGDKENHVGKVISQTYKLTLNGWELIEQLQENVAFSIPLQPIWDVTETCATCSTTQPGW